MFTKEVISEITKVAKDYEIEVPALLAIVDVESAGVAFWNINGKPLPAVRFEGHYFYDRLDGEELDTAIKAGLASPKVGGVKNPDSYEARYELINRAAAINKQAAYESVSWGLGQVMGANWKVFGYPDVQTLVDKAQSIAGQVELMVKFIEVNNLKKYIENHQWAKFAKAYNGINYKKNAYDTKMAQKYNQYLGGDFTTVAAEEYAQLQKMLNTINPDYKLTVDGNYGTNTRAAVRDYQLKNGLKVDGIYGPLTKASIEKLYLALENKKMQNTGIVASTVSVGGTTITEAAKSIQGFANTSQIIQYVFIGLLILGVIVTIWPVLFPKKTA